MNSNAWSNSHRFVFAGEYPAGLLWAIGVVAFLLIVAMAWWEYRRSGRGWMMLALPLRLIALGVVLWMLAGPAMQLLRRHTSKRGIAVLIDTSASMRTVDPFDDDANGLRWAIANGGQDKKFADLIKSMDKATAILSMADVTLHRLNWTRSVGKDNKPALRLLRHVSSLLNETQLQMRSFKPALAQAHPDLGEELGVITERLQNQVSPAINDLVLSLAGGNPEALVQKREQGAQAERLLATYTRKMRTMADDLAARQITSSDDKAREWLEQVVNASRHEKIATLMKQIDAGAFKQIRGKAELRLYQFDRQMTPLDLATLVNDDESTKTSMITDLATAITQISRENAEWPFEALVMMTDGRHNARDDVMRSAASLADLPTLIVPIGNARPVRDVILHHLRVPRTVILNDMIIIEAMVNVHDCVGEELEVELLEGDQVVDRQRMPVGTENFMGRLAFRRKALEMGEHTFSLQIKPVKNERFEDNNQAEFKVEVVENLTRVLLVDKTPRWEHRFLRNLFKRDEHIEYTEVLVSSNREETSLLALPHDLDKLGRYRVVILGDVGPMVLDIGFQNLLERYVNERGGTLVLIAGQDYMPAAYEGEPLGRMLPVEPRASGIGDRQGYNLFLTGEGQSASWLNLSEDGAPSESLWRELFVNIPVYNLSRYSQAKPASHVMIGAVLASGGDPARDSQSFLNWLDYGRGRVVFLSAPVTYQLRFETGDRYHHRFWGQMLRWATAREMGKGSRCVQLLTDKDRYVPGDPVQVTLRLRDPKGQAVGGGQCSIEVSGAKGQSTSINLEETDDDPGVYRATLADLSPGAYSVKASGPTVTDLLLREEVKGGVEIALVVDEAPTVELSETRCDRALLERVAEATGGVLMPPTGLETALTSLDLDPDVNETVTQRSLWDRWPFLWLFIGCLGLEWTLRKWRGMA